MKKSINKVFIVTMCKCTYKYITGVKDLKNMVNIKQRGKTDTKVRRKVVYMSKMGKYRVYYT